MVAIDQEGPQLRTLSLAESAIVYRDRDVVVVDKPAGVLSVADEPGNKDTLADYTRTSLRRTGEAGLDAPLGIVHRLDKETSGLMIFARTSLAKRCAVSRIARSVSERPTSMSVITCAPPFEVSTRQ